MDGYMGRKTAIGLVFSRGGSTLAFREQNFEDRSIKHCNRLGCSTRHYSMNGIQTGNQEKVKYSRGSSHSANSKMTNGSSCESSHSCDSRKTRQERRRCTSLHGRATAESSDRRREIEDLDDENGRWEIDNLEYDGRHGEAEDSESIHIAQGNQIVFSGPDEVELVNLHATGALGSCSTRLSSKACKQVSRRHRYGDQATSSSSSTRHSLTSRNTSQAAKHASEGGGAESKKSGLKRLSCTSVSDVLPSGCSSDTGPTRRVNTLRKGSSKGGSLSARGKRMSASLSGANSGSPSRGSSGLGFSVREHLTPQQDLRRTGAVSIRTCQAPSGVTRTRLSEQRDYSPSTLEPVTIAQMAQTDLSVQEVVPRCLSRSSHPEDSSTQMFNVPMADRNGYQHYNMEGIAEVLLALERIEQDEELTFEELLALEEKMGTVSTALPEEALSKCLKRSIYMPARTGCEEDVKCSICQEEYLVRDEVGKLTCEHRFHVTCIHQWLRLKNWCPICKASACPVS
uniref:RING-type E3 ubiquitin transferase n=1 Tax=Elaeis guineensis var. tenera TaxID=51953 RepID=A0A8N4F1L4_ELAGV|nr:E3 ubiquitin-protein ligase RLIM isoform X2 [Elaeis guineensis]